MFEDLITQMHILAYIILKYCFTHSLSKNHLEKALLFLVLQLFEATLS